MIFYKKGHITEQQSPPVTSALCSATLAMLLISAPASAINLGEIELYSGYGQPLRASVPISIRKGELLAPGCITLVSDRADENSLATPKDVAVSVPAAGQPGIYTISITSPHSLTEPMYELKLKIDCVGSSIMVRSYILMPEVKESGTAISDASAPESTAIPQTQVAAVAAVTKAAVPKSQPTKLAVNSEYRIKNGDSISGIAARIEPAWGSLKRRGQALLQTNPHAFVNNDPQKIQAGSLITIPAGTRATNSETAVATAAVLATVSKTTNGNPPPNSGGPGTQGPADGPKGTGGSSGIISKQNSASEAASTKASLEPAPTKTSREPAKPIASASTATSDKEMTNLKAAYLKAQEAAEAAAAADAQTTDVENVSIVTTAPVEKSSSGGLLLAVIFGGVIGIFISLLIMGKRMIEAKRRLRPPTVDPDTLPRYANDDDFVAPVSDQSQDNGFVVDEDEDVFQKTLAGDEHAAKAMAKIQLEKASQKQDDTSPSGTKNDSLLTDMEDTADDLQVHSVNTSFLDTDQDIFDATAESGGNNSIANDTVKDLFNEALFADPEDPDESSESRIKAAKDATENVQRLAKTAQEQEDDELSATLVEALHLLEQDYQEELTASQVLEPDEVQKSIGSANAGNKG